MSEELEQDIRNILDRLDEAALTHDLPASAEPARDHGVCGDRLPVPHAARFPDFPQLTILRG